MTDAVFFIMRNVDSTDIYHDGITHINIGTGEDITIKDLSNIIKSATRYKGEIEYDKTKPDGMVKKLLDSKRINDIWKGPKEGLKEGLRKTIDWYQKYCKE